VTADLSALLAAATPGPWEVVRVGDSLFVNEVCEVGPYDSPRSNEDAALIALAPVLAQACLHAEAHLLKIVSTDPSGPHGGETAVWMRGKAADALASLRAATGNSE
jgi:hypothetical protein